MKQPATTSTSCRLPLLKPAAFVWPQKFAGKAFRQISSASARSLRRPPRSMLRSAFVSLICSRLLSAFRVPRIKVPSRSARLKSCRSRFPAIPRVAFFAVPCHAFRLDCVPPRLASTCCIAVRGTRLRPIPTASIRPVARESEKRYGIAGKRERHDLRARLEGNFIRVNRKRRI